MGNLRINKAKDAVKPLVIAHIKAEIAEIRKDLRVLRNHLKELEHLRAATNKMSESDIRASLPEQVLERFKELVHSANKQIEAVNIELEKQGDAV